MDNQKEEEIARRWKVEETEKAENSQQRLLTRGGVVEVLEIEDQAPKRRRTANNVACVEGESLATSRKRTRERRT